MEEENSQERQREGHWNAQRQIKNRPEYSIGMVGVYFILIFYLFIFFNPFSEDFLVIARKKKTVAGKMVNGCDSLN